MVVLTQPQPQPSSWVLTDAAPGGILIGYWGPRGELATTASHGLYWSRPNTQPVEAQHRLLRRTASGQYFGDRWTGQENAVHFLGMDPVSPILP